MKEKLKRKGILRPLLKKYALRYIVGVAMLYLVDWIGLMVPQLTGEITDGLAAHVLDARGVLLLAGKIVLCGAAVMLGRFFWRYFIFGTARRIERDLRDQLFEKLETLSQSYYHAHKTGDLMSYFTNDLEAIRTAVGPVIVSAFDSVVMTVMVLYRMMTYVSVKLTLYTLIPMAVIAVFGYFFGEAIERRYAKMQKAFADLSDRVQESISGERIIKAFVQEKREAERFRAVNEHKRKATMDVVKMDAAFGPILRFLIGVTYVVAILYGGYLTITAEMTLGKFVAFNAYIGSLVWPMLALGDSITYFSQGYAGVDRIHEVFDAQPEVFDAPETDDVEALRGEIDIRGLTFEYRADVDTGIRGLTLHVAPGETLAIMGRTGCGKSTLVSLLCRGYEVPEGTIFYDGHDIRRIPLRTLHENIAYVPQDNFLFSDTLSRNVAFGRADATPEEIIAACTAADVHGDISDFPEQYETVVGERGVTLSGGQKQRVSIARALLKDSPILILDDSLSAVDTDTEETILGNLRRAREGKTTIMIAHRVSTVMSADHILILEDGRMAEYGSREELMAIPDGIFRTMAEKQQLERQLELEE